MTPTQPPRCPECNSLLIPVETAVHEELLSDASSNRVARDVEFRCPRGHDVDAPLSGQ